LLSYYLYLMAGALVVPVWIRAVFKGKREKEAEQHPD